MTEGLLGFPSEERTCTVCGRPYQQTTGIPGYEPTGECPGCSRARIDREEREAIQRVVEEHEDKIIDLMHRIGVNIWRHGRLTLEDLHPMARVPLQEWVSRVIALGKYEPINGVFISGPTGTGKTQACASIIREFLGRGFGTHHIIFDRSRAMITQLQDRYTTGNVDAFSEVRRRVPVWILDDAGTEKLTADALRVIEDIIDGREGRPTVITSNLSRKEFAQRWVQMDGWERLASRLQYFTTIGLDGTDHRGR